MMKIISFALVVFFFVFIGKNIKDIVVKIKAKRAQKAEENEKECDTVNFESENLEEQ